MKDTAEYVFPKRTQKDARELNQMVEKFSRMDINKEIVGPRGNPSPAVHHVKEASRLSFNSLPGEIKAHIGSYIRPENENDVMYKTQLETGRDWRKKKGADRYKELLHKDAPEGLGWQFYKNRKTARDFKYKEAITNVYGRPRPNMFS